MAEYCNGLISAAALIGEHVRKRYAAGLIIDGVIYTLSTQQKVKITTIKRIFVHPTPMYYPCCGDAALPGTGQPSQLSVPFPQGRCVGRLMHCRAYKFALQAAQCALRLSRASQAWFVGGSSGEHPDTSGITQQLININLWPNIANMGR